MTAKFQPVMIFDVGMHDAQDTEYYLKKGFWVVAVEANKKLVNKALKKFSKDIQNKKLAIENVGIDSQKANIYISKQTEFNDFVEEIGSRGGLDEVTEIQTIPLDDLLNKYGVPYYLKIDIEGLDDVCVDALANFATKPKFVSVENGRPHILERLNELGYNRFKFVNQKHVADIELPKMQREGKSIKWNFPFGSSGPFGFDTPGTWQTKSAALEEINAYWSIKNKSERLNVGWFDLHATKF